MANDTELTDYIGHSVPRANTLALLNGRGQFVDDISLPGMLHVCFVRSPYGHARIIEISKQDALQSPGVVAVITGKELLDYCKPWRAELTHLPSMQTTLQYAMPPERVCYQGEPVVAIVAESRALAEDAAELVEIDWEEIANVASIEEAMQREGPKVHPDMDSNLAWSMEIEQGELDKQFATADVIVEQEFYVDRQTGVTLEPRGIIANYNSADGQLELHHSTQVPHIKRAVYSKQLGIKESKLRIICPDLGGGFGLKLHIYSDEISTAAISMMLNRPVKFIADRLESFLSDIHARGHKVKAKMALTEAGKINALQVEDIAGGGAYLIHPRTSTIEPLLVGVCTPLAYDMEHYKANVSLVYQNKVPTAQYRGVGMPVASLVMEGMMDAAARKIQMDKAEIRKINLRPDDAYPCKSITGETLEGLSQHESLDRLLEMCVYPRLREEQRALREKGIYRGIGLVTVVEGTSPSPALYAAGGAPISSRDACTLRLESDGSITCISSLTEQGQGAYAIINQIVADTIGVKMDEVDILMGDTMATPFGGGTWASRGTSIAGEAALLSAKAMKVKILEAVSQLADAPPEQLYIKNGKVIEIETEKVVLTLEELGRITHYRTMEFPQGFDPELVVTNHYSQRDHMMLYANCAMCLTLDVDINTGMVKLDQIWVIEDCGKIINPMLVDEQIRGGVVQGIGSALFEECIYDEDAQLRNGTLADYLVPMAGEMPDIKIAHVETPTLVTELGAKGCGEAGIISICAAIMNGINDALEPLGDVSVTSQPFTPEKILKAIGKI
jgi:carbon-monoxide dehydrogenase large subunit